MGIVLTWGAKLAWVLFLIFVAAVLCVFPVYCLSFTAGERLAMGCVVCFLSSVPMVIIVLSLFCSRLCVRVCLQS